MKESKKKTENYSKGGEAT